MTHYHGKMGCEHGCHSEESGRKHCDAVIVDLCSAVSDGSIAKKNYDAPPRMAAGQRCFFPLRRSAAST